VRAQVTLIEIKPHRWGWKVFEAPDVEACVPEERSGNQLRALWTTISKADS
jgi:hypothetical protein